MAQVTFNEVWEKFVSSQSTQVGPLETGYLMLCRMIGDASNQNAVILAPNTYVKNYIEKHYSQKIIDFIRQTLGTSISILSVLVDESIELEANQNPETVDTQAVQKNDAPLKTVEEIKPVDKLAEPEVPQSKPSKDVDKRFLSKTIQSIDIDEKDKSIYYDEKSHLNVRYTFENFVIGTSNRFAQAASCAVAESPGRAYNPLFIYGGSGLGKTHLLHSIGNLAKTLNSDYVIRYVSSEEFTNDFINCIREESVKEFKEKYRKVDILLIDDIQFLKDKEQTLEEFFHTFNTLYNDQKQVVMTCDVHPKNLEGFEERLRTRFEWGLICDIQSPELETRCAILENKARSENINVPQDVISFIASRITRNIRELEGALIRVSAFSTLTSQAIDINLAREVLKELVGPVTNEPLSVETIIDITSNYFGITKEEICSNSRSKRICYPRQIAMYLSRTFTDFSLPKIGESFNKDHTTVMHALEKMERTINSDPDTYMHINELSAQINKNKF